MTSEESNNFSKDSEPRALSDTEISAVVAELQEAGSLSDASRLMRILGKCEDPSRSAIAAVERFLYEPDYVSTEQALQILCWNWGLTSQYITRLLEFMQGVPWDEYNDVRSTAIVIAGAYLDGSSEPDLLSRLIQIFENKAEDQDVRKSAYYALHYATVHTLRGLPLDDYDFNLATMVDPTILDAVKERLAREEAANREKAE